MVHAGTERCLLCLFVCTCVCCHPLPKQRPPLGRFCLTFKTRHKFLVTNPPGTGGLEGTKANISVPDRGRSLQTSTPADRPLSSELTPAPQASHLSQSNYRIIDWQAINTFLLFFPHSPPPPHHLHPLI